MPNLLAPRSAALLLGLILAGLGSEAKAEPPIRSVEDAACRLEARARVFTAPNPQGLELEIVGRRIYAACMSRLAPKPHRRHRRRHR